MEHGLTLIIPAEYRARQVAGFHAAMDSGHLAHGGVVARVEALTASGGRLVLGLSLGLPAGQDGQPSGVVGVAWRVPGPTRATSGMRWAARAASV